MKSTDHIKKKIGLSMNNIETKLTRPFSFKTTEILDSYISIEWFFYEIKNKYQKLNKKIPIGYLAFRKLNSELKKELSDLIYTFQHSFLLKKESPPSWCVNSKKMEAYKFYKFSLEEMKTNTPEYVKQILASLWKNHPDYYLEKIKNLEEEKAKKWWAGFYKEFVSVWKMLEAIEVIFKK